MRGSTESRQQGAQQELPETGLPALAKALERKHSKPAQKSLITESLADQIILRLESERSPEQISGGLALTGQQVITSRIYRHLKKGNKASGQLHLNLRINGHRR